LGGGGGRDAARRSGHVIRPQQRHGDESFVELSGRKRPQPPANGKTTKAARLPASELATRVSGGLEITLYRDRCDNNTTIELHHGAITEPISFRIPPERALDAFHQPFVYLERLSRP
jgi:hypothetical protein